MIEKKVREEIKWKLDENKIIGWLGRIEWNKIERKDKKVVIKELMKKRSWGGWKRGIDLKKDER